jgi:activator of HSP90 ATPase
VTEHKSTTRTIRQRVSIPASPQDVYEALVNAKKHAAFTQAQATGTARVGARFTAWDGYISGKHLVLEKGRRIVQEWVTTEWPKGVAASRLEILLERKGKGTLLTMLHSEVPAAQAASYRDGWKEYYWEPLKAWFRNR